MPVFLIVTTLSVSLLLAVISIAIVRCRGTTLVAPLCWTAIAVMTVCASEWLIAKDVWNIDAAIRYLAATSTLCPGVAVFGAKRPQDAGWKFIVGSLWLVSILPAIQALLFGGRLELHWAWRYFLLALVLSCWSNYLLTRFWFAATVVLVGQVTIFGEHVPFPSFHWQPSDNIDAASENSVMIGMVAFAVASLVIFTQCRPHATRGLERVWRDYRNAFGAVWGLRIMERVNEAGRVQNWSRTLQWSGFEVAENGQSADFDEKVRSLENAKIEETFRTLLRRFVDKNWIDRRMPHN